MESAEQVVESMEPDTKVQTMSEDENKNDDEKLIIDVEGYEGPLDLLLTLARSQKVDITKISILELAQQYLLFISEARKFRLELAADYLVMASWLAFLKSKLLLPEEEEEEDGPTGEELAALLSFRLQKLNAMREAAAKILTRKRLGRDVFARGMPENVRVHKTSEFQAEPYELLKAYALQRQRTSVVEVRMGERTVWSIKQARDRLQAMLGISLEWFPMDAFLAEFTEDNLLARTVAASTFGASLELAREGDVELKQTHAFGPLYVRRKSDDAQT